MNQEKRIPRAWPVWRRHLRRELAPIACFAIAVVLCGWLWERRGGSVRGVGEVDALRINVTSPVTGMVDSFPSGDRTWRPLDRVEAGELLGRLQVKPAADAHLPTAGDPDDFLEIRAPFSGTLVAIYCWPGQTLSPGELMATIAADHGRHIVSYVPEENIGQIESGMAVTVRPRSIGGKQVETQIDEVGRQIEIIPLHQIANPTSPEWGLPVRIRIPEDLNLHPGALVDVVFP